MLKARSFLDMSHKVLHRVEQALFDNAPADKVIYEPEDFEFFIYFLSGFDADPGHIHFKEIEGHAFYMKNIDQILNLLNRAKAKPRAIVGENFDMGWIDFPPYVQDTDILVTAEVCVLEHPNLLPQMLFVDDKNFFQTAYAKRIPNSIGIMADIFHFTTVAEIGVVFDIADVIYVFGIDHFSQMFGWDQLQQYEHKIVPQHFPAENPAGLRAALNTVDFVFTPQMSGYEYMNIEGGFCGAQPIYPGNARFKSRVFNDIDARIRFYDVSMPQKSLTDILETPSDWTPEDAEALRPRFGASQTVPKFWNEVLNRLAPETAE